MAFPGKGSKACVTDQGKRFAATDVSYWCTAFEQKGFFSSLLNCCRVHLYETELNVVVWRLYWTLAKNHPVVEDKRHQNYLMEFPAEIWVWVINNSGISHSSPCTSMRKIVLTFLTNQDKGKKKSPEFPQWVLSLICLNGKVMFGMDGAFNW